MKIKELKQSNETYFRSISTSFSQTLPVAVCSLKFSTAINAVIGSLVNFLPSSSS